MSPKSAPAAPLLAYVNLQPSSVTVYDEVKRSVTVCPWNDRNTNRAGGDATFVVYGPHYQQFVSGAGPLYPFPGDASVLREPGKEQGRGVTSTGPAAKVVTPAKPVDPGLPVGGEARAQILALIRTELVNVGVTTARALLQASSAQLFQATHINEGNIKFVREAAEEIFGAPPKPAPKAPAAKAETKGGKGGKSKPAATPDPAPTEDLDPNATKYKRSEVDAMTKDELIAVIEAEKFDIDTKDQKKDDLLELLLAGLTEYNQLLDE